MTGHARWMHRHLIMDASARPLRRSRVPAALTLALVATFIAAIPAAAFTSSWTKPRLVFKHDSAPTHSMVTDGAGKVHIATERGAGGVWYVSNASGSWQQCQISDRNDRQPSIALSGSVVHIAFARQTDGQKGVYTASSDQPAVDPGCGWAVTKRYSGSSSSPSLAAFGATLSIAFNTGARKLRFLKGAAASDPWAPTQVVDGKCCTSAPVLALTTTGSPRIAYGDGTSKSEGLKFAKRTSKGWKKSKVHGGRIKHIAMVLDRTPGLFGEPPSNFPRIAYVVKKQGAYLATQGGGLGAGASDSWARRLGRPPLPMPATSPRSSSPRMDAWTITAPAAVSGSPPSSVAPPPTPSRDSTVAS